MSKQKRNTHSPELKAKVALEAVRGLKTANEIAQEFGVHPVQALSASVVVTQTD